MTPQCVQQYYLRMVLKPLNSAYARCSGAFLSGLVYHPYPNPKPHTPPKIGSKAGMFLRVWAGGICYLRILTCFRAK